MKRILKILKIIYLFILLPFEISRGAKKRAYLKIKEELIQF
jgi:hypothetical protein